MNSTVKTIYKVFRTVLFSITLLAVGIFVLLYLVLSIPAFTNSIKDRICLELSNLTGGEVTIETLTIYPFNEIQVNGLAVKDPEGNECLQVETIGGGIRLWKLLFQGDIELTYGEIIGLNAIIEQKEKGGSLNIDFLINAFSKKDDNKEKKPFQLTLRNVVLRKSNVSFRRSWIKPEDDTPLNPSVITLSNLAADISFPRISDKDVEVDLRRLSFVVPGYFSVEKIGVKGVFSAQKINFENFILELQDSRIFVPGFEIEAPENGNFADALKEGEYIIEITDSYITPSEFSFLLPLLQDFNEPLALDVRIEGNADDFTVDKFSFGNANVLTLKFNGETRNLSDKEKIITDIKDLDLTVEQSALRILPHFIAKIPQPLENLILKSGNPKLKGEFSASMESKSIDGNFELSTDLFEIKAAGNLANPKDKQLFCEGEVKISDLRLNEILPQIPISGINAEIEGETTFNEGIPTGFANVIIEDLQFKEKIYRDISLNVENNNDIFSGEFIMHNALADLEAYFSGKIQEEQKSLDLNMQISNLFLSELMDLKKYTGYSIGGDLTVTASGSSFDDITGELLLSDFYFDSPDDSHNLRLNKLKINSDYDDATRIMNIRSDWFDMRAEGEFKIKDLASQTLLLTESIFPALITPRQINKTPLIADVDFDIVVKKNNALIDFFRLPVKLLVPVNIAGSIQSSSNSAFLTIDLPYLQQGKDKLIYDTKLHADINGDLGALNALIETNLPVKRGDLSLNINLFARNNNFNTDVHWINTENSDFKGHLIIDGLLSKNAFSLKPEVRLEILPSVLSMGTADWIVDASTISYSDKTVKVDGLKIYHDQQYVAVNGVASPDYADVMKISLEDIDVDYIFNTLQINYVTFGGVASGEIEGHALLSGNPVAETESIVIKDFTYNGAPLGVCVATSRWNNEEKEIEIGAEISSEGHKRVIGSGGIWLGLDSLSFKLSADKVPVDFVQPFMAVFSSHVGGYATGDVNLFGNFHDIDMTGKIFADSVAVKLDYTNTIYHGSDSVFLNPGKIEIPRFRLYDKNGNSAMLAGELTHRYFHDPSFNFRLTDANNFLCYDTSSELNPDWYGTLYGNGTALVRGIPGLVDISADMTVSGNSIFTFVLNDTQYARDYQFLTFSDKSAVVKKDTVPDELDFKALFKKRMAEEEKSLSRFGIDIRASVTPDVLFTLVMDPAAGDKITARGRGAMQVKYESDNDEMQMYGKYEIVEGNYNFSLQDIILRDFKIKEGSYIAFNGNPLAADLDISATYRVNTNLSDLDKSFSTDRDLNRTNVPVDAVLSVNGNMQQPDITFDIELPTLTQDVERKVKSIISTDDMMNRQIIYLLALNRFYTPEYMGASGNGGELAAVASSTISSQLSNILGQLTDKFSVAPSFRSDKGDFSDIEVDVALSSRLLNNRLLINGNFGYRDRSTSSTTFVGDFDVEYLLSKNGNLRLKAYNHFNDQNYYLREALTTQGLGLVFRRDFDNWFRFGKKKDNQEEKDSKDHTSEEQNDE